MRNTIRRGLATTAVAAVSAALLVAAGAPASAADAGPLKSVVNGNSPASTSGTNFDTVQVSSWDPCDPAATKHVLKIVKVTATNPADQPAATAWVGDNLYSPSTVGLPGPLTVKSSNSWQGWANVYGQTLVPANYEFELRCQNDFGTVLYEQWSGGVTFTSATAWTANALAAPKASTTTAVSASPNPATSADGVTLTATVSESDAAAPTGTVEFFNGTTSLGSAPVDGAGVASLAAGPFAVGTYQIKGTYSGDTGFKGSSGETSLSVTKAAAANTTTTLAVAPTSGPAYQNVTLSGKVSTDPASTVVPVGSCDFFDGTVSVGTSPVNSTGDCAMTSAAFAAGAHSFKAVFTPTDSTDFVASTSNIVAATYDAPSSTPDEQTIVVTVPAGELIIFTPYTTTNPLNLGNMVLAPDGASWSATAPFRSVRITDTRAGNPGWTASLLRADFVGSTDTPIQAEHSGFENVAPEYIPGNAIQAPDVVVNDIPANSGPVVGPASFAKTTAGNGTGTVDVNADFVLEQVPTSTKAGTYTATVTFTVA